jgi:FAD/FMN-containing dehydrogenase
MHRQLRQIATAPGGGDGIAGAVRDLRRDTGGAVHLPGTAGYDVQRRTLDASFDARPAVVVEAEGAADVRAAVVAAREHDLPFAVQATGHGTRVPADGGILVKTGAMRTVMVDPDRRVAHLGAGARWGDVLAAAAPFGLAPLSGSAPDVGVAGYTLGGGVGWLARLHGFAADSLVRAEVVTAEGRMATACADHNADLFWALRGGGGGFGVVTAMEVRLYPVAAVYAGTSYFAIDRAAETLARYRDWITGAPDALSTAVLLTRVPEAPDVPEALRGRRALAIRAMYAGPAGAAERELAPLRDAAGPALLEGLRPVRFADAAMGGTAPRRLDLLHTLPDTVIETLVAASEDATVEVRHWGGAMARPAAEAGPAGHRTVPLSVIVDAVVPGVAEALDPHATGGSFLNFLADPAKVDTAFTPANLRRLRAVKRAYDPGNLFRTGLHVAPAEAPRGVEEARLRW